MTARRVRLLAQQGATTFLVDVGTWILDGDVGEVPGTEIPPGAVA